MTPFEIAWLSLASVFTAIELFAVFRRPARDTLSGSLWSLSHKTWFRMCLFALDGWLVWHLIVQPYLPWDTTHIAWIDWAIVGVLAFIGFSIGSPRWRKLY